MKTISLANVPAKRRSAAIQLELMAWTPFLRTSHYVVPQEQGALLMAWDRDAVEMQQSAHAVNDQDIRVIPESALLVSPVEGVTLHNRIDGVEAIYVGQGQVLASQWWPRLPDSHEWLNFQRNIGLPANARAEIVPNVGTSIWRDSPAGYAAGRAAPMQITRELTILAIIAILLAVPTLWFANDWRRHALAMRESEARLAATEQELNGLLGARGSALGAKFRADKLYELFNQPDAVLLFGAVAKQLQTVSKAGAPQLTEWDWRNRHLKFAFVSNGSPPAATSLVKALESQPAFRDVQVAVEGNRFTVDLRVDAGASLLPTLPSQPTSSLVGKS